MMENAPESDDDRVSQAEEKAYMGPRGNLIAPPQKIWGLTQPPLVFLVSTSRIDIKLK